jgi:hypothetical protein
MLNWITKLHWSLSKKRYKDYFPFVSKASLTIILVNENLLIRLFHRCSTACLNPLNDRVFVVLSTIITFTLPLLLGSFLRARQTTLFINSDSIKKRINEQGKIRPLMSIEAYDKLISYASSIFLSIIFRQTYLWYIAFRQENLTLTCF